MSSGSERPDAGPAARPTRLTRRAVLAGAIGAMGGAAVGMTATSCATTPVASSAAEAPPSPQVVPVYGTTQAGITRPAVPQAFGLVTVGDLAGDDVAFLPRLGAAIADLVTGSPADLLPDGPVSLTVTVGLGPRVLAARSPGSVGSQALPAFAHDGTIEESASGGDLLLAVHAADPTVLAPVTDRLTGLVPGYRGRWSQRCFRGPSLADQDTIIRNPFGFHDNIQIPHTDQELSENTWLDGVMSGGTICVIRRLRLDTTRFRALPVGRREEIIGRRLDGSPLSGGAPFAEVAVNAKAPDGAYLIPANAHVRAAHPSFTGSNLMLRRGYAYDDGAGESGLLFISFQRDLRTFVMTQRRLDDIDDLMTFTTPTASATFLVLPGYDEQKPLGWELQ